MVRLIGTICAAVLLAGCIEAQVPSPQERALLLDVSDFAELAAPVQGRYKKQVTYAARTVELSFESQADADFYLYSGITLHPRPSDALLSSYAETFGASVALQGSGLEQQALELSADLATRATLKLLTQDGEPVGNLFYASLGNKSFFTLFTGVYFEQPGEFEQFITAPLAALRAYRHEDPLLAWARDALGLGSD